MEKIESSAPPTHVRVPLAIPSFLRSTFLHSCIPTSRTMSYRSESIRTMTPAEFEDTYKNFAMYEESAYAHPGALRQTMAELVVAAYYIYGGGNDVEDGGCTLLDKIRFKLYVRSGREDEVLDVDVVKTALRNHTLDLVDAVRSCFTYEELCVYGV
jgi:hypothetical protein